MIEFIKEQDGTQWVNIDTHEELDSFKSVYAEYADPSFIAHKIDSAPCSIEMNISRMYFADNAIDCMKSELN